MAELELLHELLQLQLTANGTAASPFVLGMSARAVLSKFSSLRASASPARFNSSARCTVIRTAPRPSPGTPWQMREPSSRRKDTRLPTMLTLTASNVVRFECCTMCTSQSQATQ